MASVLNANPSLHVLFRSPYRSLHNGNKKQNGKDVFSDSFEASLRKIMLMLPSQEITENRTIRKIHPWINKTFARNIISTNISLMFP